MALREILTFPDPRLKDRALPVEKVDDEIRALIDDMVETMYSADGVGLAAPQIGVSKRIIVVDCNPREDDEGNALPKKPFAVVNPVAIQRDVVSLPRYSVRCRKPLDVDFATPPAETGSRSRLVSTLSLSCGSDPAMSVCWCAGFCYCMLRCALSLFSMT